jgi:Fanconi-associated nuclease 1
MMLRRLQRLEKRLRIPPEEVYVGEGDLKSAIETRIEGTRVYAPPIPVIASKQSDSTSVLALSRLNTTRPGSRSPTLPATVDGKQQRTKWTGKSIWVGKAGDVNVETLALEYYATLGFRG